MLCLHLTVSQGPRTCIRPLCALIGCPVFCHSPGKSAVSLFLVRMGDGRLGKGRLGKGDEATMAGTVVSVLVCLALFARPCLPHIVLPPDRQGTNDSLSMTPACGTEDVDDCQRPRCSFWCGRTRARARWPKTPSSGIICTATLAKVAAGSCRHARVCFPTSCACVGSGCGGRQDRWRAWRLRGALVRQSRTIFQGCLLLAESYNVPCVRHDHAQQCSWAHAHYKHTRTPAHAIPHG